MLEWIKKNTLDKFQIENVTSRYIIGFLVLLIMWQQFVLSNRITGQRTVFMPPKIVTKEFWIAGNEVSSSYLEMMGQFVIFNLFDVTPENAKFNGDNLLAIVEPKFYEAVDSTIQTQQNYLTVNQISRTFYIGKINAKTPGVIVVEGLLREHIADKMISKQNVVVSISYNIEQGRFWLRGIDAQVKGGHKE